MELAKLLRAAEQAQVSWLAAMPFELDTIRRSAYQQFEDGTTLKLADASDLIIMKAFANRPRDGQDIRGIIVRQRIPLDWTLIEGQLALLAELKEEPEILPTLRSLRHHLNEQAP